MVDFIMNTDEIYLDKLFKLAKNESEIDNHEVHVIEILKQYLKARPNHGQAWFMYGECLRIIGRLEESMDSLIRAVGLAPDEKKSRIYGRIGFLCTKFRAPTEAESWYRLGVDDKYCDVGWIWLLRGVNFVDLGNFENAIYCFSKSQDFDDIDKSEVFLNKGIAFRAMGEYSKAIYFFRNALKIDPDYVEAKECLNSINEIEKTLNQMMNDK